MYDLLGRTILHFKIIEKLGEGGMGVVYLAEDINLERKVAIKFLPEQISANSEERQRFKIEAKAAAALDHPNITTVYSIEEADGKLFIVMEYIKGVELSNKIKSGIIQADEAIKIASQIAGGLAAAHKEGIIHRDIKSNNIMITESGIAKIMDFGLAKIKGSSKLTQIGTTVGTIAYMSPEQSRGEEVDHRTDIWSFGVVLYEMVNGKLPFNGDYDQAIIYSIINEEPQSLSEIDKRLQPIIRKTLAKNPEDRYQDAAEIEEELINITESKKIIIKEIPKRSKLPWMIFGVMLLIIVAVMYIFIPSSSSITKKEGVKTIAVLPFADMSPKKDQGYLSEGLSEALINILAKNPNLRVTARTSSFYFKGKNVDIKTIASKLNVKNILEGSIQKSGNLLRISADLVNVKNDATLWSNIYDGSFNNIFALQDSISISVAKALNATLLGKETTAPEQKTDPRAYNYYLLGKYYQNLRGKKNLQHAISYYDNALKIDSDYAPVWVSLSSIHSALAENEYMSSNNVYNIAHEGLDNIAGIDSNKSLIIVGSPRLHKYGANQNYLTLEKIYGNAMQEIKKALAINPNLTTAYTQMGWIKSNYYFDWNGAEEAYLHALKLEPENADVLRETAVLEFSLGRIDKAISLSNRSININPLNAVSYSSLGLITWYAGYFNKSIAAFRKALYLNPQFKSIHTFIGLIYLAKGKTDSALTEITKETEPMWQMFGLALVYQELNRKKESNSKLNDLIKKYGNTNAFQIAEIYSYCGEKDKAFKWLNLAYNQHDLGLAQIKDDPLFYNIKKDPRFIKFLKKMNLTL